MNVKVLTTSQKTAIEAAIAEEINLFIQAALSAAKNGINLKTLFRQLDDKGLCLIVNEGCATVRILRIGDPIKENQGTKKNRIKFSELHTIRNYVFYLLSHGYNVSFNDWED